MQWVVIKRSTIKVFEMNNIKSNKLELSWIGKDKLPRLEPRIFLESKEYSYFNVSVDIGQDSEQVILPQ
ncbi:hypothetical protein BOW35_12740 [Solemya velum gill symbiont]|nr:hypothetical protein BOW27_11725 [Solemya velum gill symbiont]OOZ16924.1 hypothetical protein BOW29_11725 [Solemya velum gill symbiont]OOZ19940.1 hypothetical protein BOW30_12645 [Solemya velum gill symbiont]OOZ21371.1 hypothetical protein BOW31_12765 [Solemya velum gill symbiont]OOZ26473.1 hypothetical protein BOW33_12735 [Solemya velum gill symbiont]